MDGDIPDIVELIYRAVIPGPNPQFWPEHLKDDPQLAHSMWTFYCGLRMGLQLGGFCLGGM